MENMKDIDIIMEIENGELCIEDYDGWDRVKELAKSLARSQGFYGRLYRSMCDYEDECLLEYGGLAFPIMM